jgi:hypothetical protein
VYEQSADLYDPATGKTCPRHKICTAALDNGPLIGGGLFVAFFLFVPFFDLTDFMRSKDAASRYTARGWA